MMSHRPFLLQDLQVTAFLKEISKLTHNWLRNKSITSVQKYQLYSVASNLLSGVAGRKMKMKKLMQKMNQPSRSRDEISSKHLLVFCNISARLSRYFGDIHAGSAHYRTKLTCSQPVKLLHS